MTDRIPDEARCPSCLGSGKASDYHTTTVEAAARYEEFLGGHGYPRCGRCKGTGSVAPGQVLAD